MSSPRTRTATALLSAAALAASGLSVFAASASADTSAQALPLTQDWSNAGLITANDDWSGVPGIIGYRGDGLTTADGVDPQTVLTEGTPVVDVNANQTDPSVFNTGGVAEFAITNPVVALAGSGTADAPNLVATVNTSGAAGVNVAYVLRDVDGSTDNAVQPFALQYRVGSSGAYTNVPEGYVADASSGPSLATLTTPVSVTLPTAAAGQPVVQVRVITTNAGGNDEFVGVDDLRITSTGGGTAAGTPTASCPSTVTTTTAMATSATLTAIDADSLVVGAEDTTATPTGTIRLSGFTASRSAGDTATATLTVDAGTPAGTYPTTITFRTGDTPAQTVSCTVNVVVQEAPGAVVRISAVQGATTTSPRVGDRLSVEGVVTTTKTRNDVVESFFVQEQAADQDANPETSEGLFVLCGTLCPSGLTTGDVVTATGVVSETNGTTRLTANNAATGAVARSAVGAPLPAPVDVTLPSVQPLTDQASFERVESMLTRVTTTLSVSEYFALARFGEVVLSAGGRPYQFTHDNLPSVSGNVANNIELAKRRITLDDGSEDQNDAVSGPQSDEPYPYPSGGLSLTNRFRGGDTITGITAVMEYGFGAYRLQPLPTVDYRFVSTNPRTTAPDPVGGRLKVAAANVLNYFATVDTTTSTTSGPCAPSGTQDCRGADSDAELIRQRAKTVAELKAIDADVFGLIEIQNDAATATAQIVDALNAATSPGRYDYIRTGTIGTDAIKQALVYKVNTVSPVGPFRTLTTAIDPDFIDTRNRPSLIQTFQERKTGSRVTIAVNHFKSKGSDCLPDDPDKGDGSGNCDGTRTRAAEALRDYLATDPTGSGDPDFLVIGDLNSYKQEAPITTLERAGYTDLIERFGGDRAYGYLFGGQLGYLDHALASSTLNSQVTGATEWHINADEPVEFDYNDTVRDAGEAVFERESAAQPLYAADPYRSSDHDAVVVGLNLAASRTTPYPVQVLGINDFHGRLEPPSAAAAPSTPSRGGAAFLSGAINQFRNEVRNTTVVSAGDNIGATPFASAVAQDAPAIEALNAMALEATSVGNHEFDRGYVDLAGRVSNLAGFPFLGANVAGESPQLPTTHTVTLADGITIGMVGATTEQTGVLVSPDGIRGITFADIVGTVNTAATALTDGNAANGEADVVLLMLHEGPEVGATTQAACDTARARNDAFGAIARGVTPRVDAIFAGHTHVVVDCEIAQTTEAGYTAKGLVRPVLEAGEYGQFLDRLRFTWNPLTRTITDIQTDVVPVLGVANNPNPATGFQPDPVVQRIVTDAVANARVLGRPVIGSITADIRRAFLPPATPGGNPVENRGAESVLGNFVADVQLEAVNQPDQDGAQIAFMNPGGLRTDLTRARDYGGEAVGEITFGEAAEVQPFANTLFLLTLTGAQIKNVLEQQYQPAGATRPFLALGVSKGLFFLTDGTAPAGSRISGITFNGQPLDPAANYRVVTNSFLASGGDNFPALAGGANRVDTGLDDLRALTEFFRRNSPVTADTTPRRGVRSTEPTASPTATMAPSPTGSPSPTMSPSSAVSPSPTTGPTGGPTTGPTGGPTTGPTGTPTGTPTGSPTGSPSVPPACATVPTVVLDRSTIIATGAAGVTVRGPAGQTVDLLAYTRPSSTYRVVRTGVIGSDGTITFPVLRPPANTRLYAQLRGCTTDAARDSVVLNVRTALSLFAERTGRRTYVFSGDSLPARPGGLIVSLYRVTADGRQVLTSQTRANATTGEWTITRRFTGSGRFGFVVRTGQDLQNAPGASNVRSTQVF